MRRLLVSLPACRLGSDKVTEVADWQREWKVERVEEDDNQEIPASHTTDESECACCSGEFSGDGGVSIRDLPISRCEEDEGHVDCDEDDGKDDVCPETDDEVDETHHAPKHEIEGQARVVGYSGCALGRRGTVGCLDAVIG